MVEFTFIFERTFSCSAVSVALPISVKLEDYIFRSVFQFFFWFCMSSICFFIKTEFFLKATVKRSCAKMRNNTVSSKVIWMWIRSSDQANLLWLMRISSGFDSAALHSVQQRKAVRILRLPQRLQAKKKHCFSSLCPMKATLLHRYFSLPHRMYLLLLILLLLFWARKHLGF